MSVCGCDNQGHEGFDGVHFEVMADQGSGVYRDWVIKERLVQTTIPGTNRVYDEHMGFDPARVSWTLSFCCQDAYHALLARYGMTATLTVLYDYQSLKGTGPPTMITGRLYEHLDNVLLLDIDDTPHFVDGSIEADVTFRRTVDPVTRLAVVV